MYSSVECSVCVLDGRLIVTIKELITTLKKIKVEQGNDVEAGHMLADVALLDYIDNLEVRAAFRAIERWYS